MFRWVLIAALLAACNAAPSPPTAATTAPRAASPAPSPTLSTPIPNAASLPRCDPARLDAVASWAEVGDMFVGAVLVANRGTDWCSVQGNPRVILLAAGGRPLGVQLAFASGTREPGAIAVPVTTFQEDPRGLLGIGASAPLSWSNYCGDAAPERFTMTLTDGGRSIEGRFVELSGAPAPKSPTPRCEDPADTSTLVVYPFQLPR